jgi:peptidoglycan glycosyltransferase
VGSYNITCESVHGEQDLKSAFCNSCNCAFAQIALQLGGETLEWYARQFGVTDRITFDGITTAAGNFEASDTSAINVAWSGVGQYNDLINPCAFLTFVGAIASDGKGSAPYLVEKITVGKNTTYAAQTQTLDRVMSAETAKILQEYLRNNVQQRYGDDYFPGLQVCAKTGTAEVGGDQKPNAMLTGFVLDEEYPLAFMVCVEDAGYGGTVCLPIASQILNACKAAIDEI